MGVERNAARVRRGHFPAIGPRVRIDQRAWEGFPPDATSRSHEELMCDKQDGTQCYDIIPVPL